MSAPTFAARDVAAHLKRLRDAAAGAPNWWKPALDFGWKAVRPSATTSWCSITYTSPAGVRARLRVRVNGEHHAGRILPNTEAGMAEYVAKMAAAGKRVEASAPRDRKPALQFNKWFAKVETDADEVTIKCDDAGNPLLPPDEALSAYYIMLEHINEAFLSETRELLLRGADVARAASEAKAKKVAETELGALLPAGPAILNSEQATEVRKAYPKASAELLKRYIVASNTKVAPLIQDVISQLAKKNQGMPLPNPIARAGMDFDPKTGRAITRFFDGSKPIPGASRQYEVFLVDGCPVSAENVHNVVLPRATIDGLVNVDSVCFSSMGISVPTKVDIVVVTHAAESATTLDDVFGDEDGGASAFAGESAAGGGAAFAPSPPPAPAPEEEGGGISADAMADMLADLTAN